MHSRKRSPTRKSIQDAALNVLLGLLLLSLFSQCGFYIARYARTRATQSEIPFDMRVLSSSTQELTKSLNPALLAPEAIAVQTASSCKAIFNSAALIGDMYSEISECLYSALSGEPIPSDGEAWRAAVQKNGVYVRYSSELPYQVLHAFAAAETGSSERIYRAQPYIGVHELYLVPDDTGKVSAVLVRGSGGTYTFPLRTERTLEDYSRYTAEYPDVFYTSSLTIRDAFTEISVSEPVSARTIIASGGIISLLTANAEDLAVILRLLDFNPDKLNYHTEPDGARVYVESHGILRADSYELAYQASESGGVSAAALCGTTDHFDIYACLRAASSLIDRLTAMNELYTSGDAALYLDSVSAHDDRLTLHFVYRCDNIAIIGENQENYFSMTFTGDKLTELRFRMLVVNKSLLDNRVFLQSWTRNILAPQKDAKMRLVYCIDAQLDTIPAQWAAVMPNGMRS